MFKEMLQMSYLIFITAITLMIFMVFNSTFNSVTKFRFILGNSIATVMVVTNVFAYCFQGTGEHVTALKICTAISYSISGTVILPFIFITGVIGKHMRYLLQVLATFNIILSIISIFNSCVFEVDSDGEVSLGILSPIPFYFSALYIVVLFYASIVKYRLGFRSESFFITILCAAIITAVILNTFYGYKFLISGMAVMGCTFYYMFYSLQTLTHDAMTGALNRHSFYKDIQIFQKQHMFIISMDLNGLKQINDNLGHDAGDRAILTVSQSAMSVIPLRCRFYRMGGDEFVILCPDMNAGEVKDIADRIDDAVTVKEYSVAIGYEEYHKGMDINEVLKKADAIMYARKTAMKNEDVGVYG
ncbi:MAG: GGDEF domain-containing protein [Ruminococcus sp.]|nr:GGDEF domain-containing protein [Ruminococcus sp.]